MDAFLPDGGVVIYSLPPNVGDTLRALIFDEDGNEINPDDVDAEIQWSADGVEITDATKAEYTVLEGDVGVVLSVEVTIGDETYTAETEEVEPAEEPVEELTVTIVSDDEIPTVGELLTAVVTDEDGELVDAELLHYQWYAGEDAIDESDTAILLVTDEFVGKTLSVEVTDADGNTFKSEPTAEVEAGEPVEELTVSIDNTTPKVGDTLTAEVVDRNGEDVSDNVTFQWYADDVAIEGADDETLVVDNELLGAALKVVVTAENGNTFESKETAEVEFRYSVEIAPTAPVVGDTIEATIYDEDGEEVEDVEDFDFQWYADDEAIEDATANEYEVTADDLGKAIKVVVTDVDDVEYESDETAEVELGEILVGAKMLASKKVEITFAFDASEIVNKDNLKITTEDGTLTIPVTNLEWADEVANATLSIALTDGTTYTVAYEDSEVDFTASIGGVASIGISTIEAEVNTDTPIEFTLFDAEGVDVTESEDIVNRITIDVSGDTSSYSVSDPTKATLKMDTVGAEAEITITYTPEDSSEEPIVESQTVTCVKATETKGTGVFAQASGKAVNANSSSAKFYNGLSTSGITIVEGKTANNVYFYAADENGDAINYDNYEVSASDEDVISASADVTEGKFAKIDVTGLKPGSSAIVVAAEKNGVKSMYTVPVTVKKKGAIKTVKLTISRDVMTNAIDNRYTGLITAQVFDTNDVDITDLCDINYEKSDTTKTGTDSLVDLDLDGDGNNDLSTELGADGFDYTQRLVKKYCDYTADGAKAGKYVINCTASDDSGETKTAQATIRVEAISTDAWNVKGNANNAGASIKYDIETSGSSVDEVKGNDAYVTARLRALSGSKFVGYVDGNGGIGTNSKTSVAYTPSTAADATAHIKYEANVNENLDGIKFVTVAGVAEAASTVAVTGVNWTAAASDKDLLDGLNIKTKAPAAQESVELDYATATGWTLTLTPAAAPDTVAKVTTLLSKATFKTTLTDTPNPDNSAAVLAAVKRITVTDADTTDGITWAAGNGTMNNYVAPVAPSVVVSADKKTITYTFTAGTAQADIEADYAALATDPLAAKFTATGTGAPAANLAGTATSGWDFGTPEYSIKATTATAIDPNGKVQCVVKFGSNYALAAQATGTGLGTPITDNTINLFDQATTFGNQTKYAATSMLNASSIALDAVSGNAAKVYCPTDVSLDTDFAKVGTYTIYFLYGDKSHDYTVDKWAEATTTVKVVNTIKAPKVNVTSRKVAGATIDDFQEVLKLNVDLNNKDGAAESLTGLYTDLQGTAATEANSKVVVKYVGVEENIFGTANDVEFLINLGNTFTVD